MRSAIYCRYIASQCSLVEWTANAAVKIQWFDRPIRVIITYTTTPLLIRYPVLRCFDAMLSFLGMSRHSGTRGHQQQGYSTLNPVRLRGVLDSLDSLKPPADSTVEAMIPGTDISTKNVSHPTSLNRNMPVSPSILILQLAECSPETCSS